DTQVVMIAEPLPTDLAGTELVFNMTGGKFNLSPGADGLVNGSITYNVERWEPEFTRSTYYYEIKQKNPYSITGIPTGDIENHWDFGLSTVLPLDLTIEGGASENTFDFSGLQLTNLSIIQGASETEVRFDSPNPVLMKELTFKTGASSAKLYGLGHANFISMNFSCGAGDYTLDFSGTLSMESTVDIKAGVSNLTIIIPADMNAAIVNHGMASNINTQGTWLVTDETYTTMVEGPKLTINLDMAVGNINLIHE
ncbi:MAG: hypothetical protein XE06_1069, partial [Anaerolineaceae bacterium 46_22]